jgi:hypothetical protein
MMTQHKRVRASTMLAILLFAPLVLLLGCQKTIRTSDPQLKPIQDMLDQQVPIGSTIEHVTTFIATRGYPTEPPEKTGTLIAVIRHIDTRTVQPVTARVTFYFDANGKLNTYEMQRTLNQPIPQPAPQ